MWNERGLGTGGARRPMWRRSADGSRAQPMWAERGESAVGKRKRKGLLADFSFLSLLSELTQLYLNSNEI
jgi:hypothetical protein